ncbi:thioredoxin domain-containing protein [Streptomyces sp. ACA25]|uniref:DsbA family protein n=1 Tax=Streptomyces sp. ACA25 TaxID=3022596 RepID=UPI0023076F82|nr:thioredoxin domain-containing protein [Streptomyces sp. ACA25]MDB1088608.1 thioredoxin domain-containing protein [Streptomyces sp. ACA25]
MSENTGEGKRTARERLHAEREREEAARKRLRTVKVLGAAGSVVVLAGIVGYVVAGAGGDGEESSLPAASPISQGQAEAPATLTVYEDFRCPACAQFEGAFKDTIRDLEKEGKLRTEYHSVTIIDEGRGGTGSMNAANAVACARDEGRFTEYHDALFAHEADEAADPFADKNLLLELAGGVEGLDTDTFRGCVMDGAHEGWVERLHEDFLEAGHAGTPTILLNGDSIFGDPADPLTPDRLRERVEKIAADAS